MADNTTKEVDAVLGFINWIFTPLYYRLSKDKPCPCFSFSKTAADDAFARIGPKSNNLADYKGELDHPECSLRQFLSAESDEYLEFQCARFLDVLKSIPMLQDVLRDCVKT